MEVTPLEIVFFNATKVNLLITQLNNAHLNVHLDHMVTITQENVLKYALSDILPLLIAQLIYVYPSAQLTTTQITTLDHVSELSTAATQPLEIQSLKNVLPLLTVLMDSTSM